MHLLYFADPLCSWCYGFGPELTRLLERHPDAKLDLVMGGLRPFNTEVMSPAFKEMLQEHWKHVGEASGLPFSEALFARDDFVYDTEPPCRAVVTARILDSAKAFAYLKAVQTAFYRDARKVTRPEVLAEIASECGFDQAEFLAQLESAEMRDETKLDFSTTQSLGVSGFPTLGVGYGAHLYLVASGFTASEVLEQRLVEIDRIAAKRTTAPTPAA